MKNVYGHLQKIIEETLLTVSALDSITLQFPKKFSSVTAIKLIQTDAMGHLGASHSKSCLFLFVLFT